MKGCHERHIELLRTIVRQLNDKIFYLKDLATYNSNFH